MRLGRELRRSPDVAYFPHGFGIINVEHPFAEVSQEALGGMVVVWPLAKP
ncbi:MAG TPA: hypothetical protein VGK55_04500 [Actinomycetes bacterium]